MLRALGLCDRAVGYHLGNTDGVRLFDVALAEDPLNHLTQDMAERCHRQRGSPLADGKFGKLWRASSRLYRSRFLQANVVLQHFSR